MGNCFVTNNYEGKRCIFTKKQRQLKIDLGKHPELKEEPFLKRIINAIQKPSFVYEDLANKKRRRCYYLEEYRLNGQTYLWQ